MISGKPSASLAGVIRRFVSRRLRLRTAALFLLGGVVPILLSGAAACAKFESELVRGIIGGHRQIIQQVRRGIETEMRWNLAQVERLTRQIGIQSGETERMRQDLEAFLAFHTLFHRVEVRTANGSLLNAAIRGAVLTRETASGLPEELLTAFDEVLRTGRAAITAPVTSDAGQVRLHFLAVAPNFVDGQPPVGVVIAAFRIHGLEIQDLVEGESALSGATYLFLTAPDGRIVARAGTGAPGHVRNFQVRDVPQGEDGIVAGAADVAGRRDLIAAADVGLLGLKVVVGKPYDEVRASIFDLLRTISLYVAAGVLIALLLGLYLSAELVVPILGLVKGIQRVARGEVSYRIPVEREDELGRAAEAFNEMATQLEKGRLLEELWQVRRGPPRS